MTSLRAALPAIGLVVFVGAAAAGVSTAACYAPTEVQLVLTTTVPCAPGPDLDTELYIATGVELDGGALAPSAAVRGCKAEEPRVGTLTIVPSDSRGDRFDVEIIAGVGVPASTCRGAGLANCIVARRRVGFREHQSLRVPILLSDRCVGLPCGFDQTCDLGVCVQASECTEESGCPRERGEIPVVDAGPDGDANGDGASDASIDANVDAAVDASCGPTPEVVVEGQSINGQLAQDGADFVYANIGGAAAREVRRVPRSGGPHAVVAIVPTLSAVTAGDASLAWASQGSGGVMIITRQPRVGVSTTEIAAMHSTGGLAFSGTAIVGMGVALSGARGFSVTDDVYFDDSFFPGYVTEVAVDADGDWFGVSQGQTVVHYAVIAGKSSLIGFFANSLPKSSDIAVADKHLFVALGVAGQPGVHRIAKADITQAYVGAAWLPGVFPRSLAASGTSLYYIAGSGLERVSTLLASDTVVVHLANIAGDADRLQVDRDCVYWVEGNGARIMKRAK